MHMLIMSHSKKDFVIFWLVPSYTTHKNKFKMDHTRTNSKWIKHLNVRPETIKILEENIGSKISDIAHRIFLSAMPPRQGEQKEK